MCSRSRQSIVRAEKNLFGQVSELRRIVELMKREPITIDVTPEVLEVERPARLVRLPKEPRPRSPVTVLRDVQRMGKIVRSDNFWIGLVASLWMKER